MSIFKDGLIRQGASVPTTAVHQIDQSIRFNKDDNAYMQRTNSSGGNTDLFTISFWFKRCRMTLQSQNDEMAIFGGGNDVYNTFDIMFSKQDELIVWDYQSSYLLRLITTQKFRDVSAWYHFVFVYDSAEIVPEERARLFINGERVTSFGTETYQSQNQNSVIGTNSRIGFGRYISYNTTNKHLDAYLAEMHYVNGYGYGPEYFGEFNSDNIWIPKEYEGSYGTGGFFIDGRDSSDLGDDESGNGNDLTTSGLATNDQVTDSPTNNFAVLNSVAHTYGTVSDGNLDYVGNSSNHDMVVATYANRTGKWYCEGTLTNPQGDTEQVCMFGVVDLNSYTPGTSPTFPGGNAASWGYYPDDGANPGLYNNGSRTDTLASATTNQIIGMALDCDAGTCSWYKNNVLLITKTIGSGDWAFVIGHNQGNGNINFGQQGFTYTPPTGYKAVNSKNVGS